jgi:hypothetical protein
MSGVHHLLDQVEGLRMEVVEDMVFVIREYEWSNQASRFS